MKYTTLDHKELQKLEKEFVEFLVVNGITADDWTKIQEDKEQAQSIIESFSDVIWEGVLQRTRYLVRQTSNAMFAFHFGMKDVQLFIIHSTKSCLSWEDWKGQVDLEMEYQTKPYKSGRSKEIFDLIQGGALISDGKEFQHWSMVWADQH